MKKLIYILAGCLFSLHIVYADKQIDVKTPKGSSVVAWICDEMSASDIAYFDQIYTSNYPKAVMLEHSTNKYNCHGYAWHMSEGGDARWIGYKDDTDEDIYMEDGSYIEVSAGPSPRKISFKDGDHSAITTDQQGVFISKWNCYPLMRHTYEDCPYSPSTLRYFIKYTKFDMGGSDFICKDTPMTFSLNYQPIKPVNWIVPNSLRIISGQGTSSITVEAVDISSSQEVIKAKIDNAEITKVVTLNGINVTGILGNSRCKPNTPQTYNAQINAVVWPQGLDWKWEIACSYPQPAYTIINSQLNVTFTRNDSYTLRCWIVSPCGYYMGTGYLYVMVGPYYSIQLDPQSGNLQITANDNLTLQNIRVSSFSTYEIVHASTGRVASKGRFDNANGLSTYINDLSKGIYLIRIVGPDGEEEVQKISF